MNMGNIKDIVIKWAQRGINSQDDVEEMTNDMHDAMSAWIEGAVPSEDEIKVVLKEHHDYVDNMFYISDCAHAIHTLLTQRLGGK